MLRLRRSRGYAQHEWRLFKFYPSSARPERSAAEAIRVISWAYWVREKHAMTLERAIQVLAATSARVMGLHDRGTIEVGKAADLVVFNPATIRPQATETVNELPGGNARLCQGAEGIRCTVVNGTVVTQDGVHTGAYPGQVLRA